MYVKLWSSTFFCTIMALYFIWIIIYQDNQTKELYSDTLLSMPGLGKKSVFFSISVGGILNHLSFTSRYGDSIV